MTAILQTGTKVRWTSQARGVSTVKEGEIVAIVNAGKDPGRIFRELMRDGRYKSGWGGGVARDEVSYIVAVPGKGSAKPTLYWPRVSSLLVLEGRAVG